MARAVWTQDSAFTIQIDSAIDYPAALIAVLVGNINTNNFTVTWTNPSDLSEIVAAYYKTDALPLSKIDGNLIASTNITQITGIVLPSTGTHVIYVWLADAAGNIDQTKCAFTTLNLSTTSTTPASPAPSTAEGFIIGLFGGITVIATAAFFVEFVINRKKMKSRRNSPE